MTDGIEKLEDFIRGGGYCFGVLFWRAAAGC